VPAVRHADYIGAWLDVLRDDNRAIVRAASQASKAADLRSRARARASSAVAATPVTVREAAVIAMPHHKWGERPLLLVVAADGVEVSPDQLLEGTHDVHARILGRAITGIQAFS
jgi:acyl-CoA synthetase (AMP-forming)/AMP-acid ligase II